MKTIKDLNPRKLIDSCSMKRDDWDRITHIELHQFGDESLGFWAEADFYEDGFLDEDNFYCGHIDEDDNDRECTEQETEDLMDLINDIKGWAI